jgi:hypothetical protein
MEFAKGFGVGVAETLLTREVVLSQEEVIRFDDSGVGRDNIVGREFSPIFGGVSDLARQSRTVVWTITFKPLRKCLVGSDHLSCLLFGRFGRRDLLQKASGDGVVLLHPVVPRTKLDEVGSCFAVDKPPPPPSNTMRGKTVALKTTLLLPGMFIPLKSIPEHVLDCNAVQR